VSPRFSAVDFSAPPAYLLRMGKKMTEDEKDIAAARKALADPRPSITLEELKKRLAEKRAGR
jgi:hypothetical protein